jgi:uncharacterized membrane protein
MDIEHTDIIPAPVHVVWEVTADVVGLPQATPTITAVEVVDPLPLRVGSRVRLTQPGLSTRVWTVTVLEPEHVFEWATSVLGVGLVGRHELREVDAGCENHLTVSLVGRGSGLLGRLVRGRMEQTLATEQAGFARAAAARVAAETGTDS